MQLPGDRIVRGLVDARHALSEDGDVAFGEAIRTTDAFAKRVSLELELPSGTVRLAAQARARG